MTAGVQAVLKERRSKITLLRHPLQTSRLFASFASRWLLHQAHFVATHPLFVFLILPLAISAVVWSNRVVGTPSDVLFRRFDRDANGFVSPAELDAAAHVAAKRVTNVSASGIPASGLDKAAFGTWWEVGVSTKLDPSDFRHEHYFDHGAWREMEYLAADAVYWIGLGVLSSVGLGTGLQSGVLFLFPHIFRICNAAAACGHTNFWTYPTNFFYGPSSRVYHCIEPERDAGNQEAASWWARFLIVLPWCVLWGAGTALGEIPPYALSYAAAKEGKRNEELEETSALDVVNRLKDWTIDQIRRWGFWAVFLLAAWPNAAFDLCGMACGQFMMPFWTFFSAVFLGKAIVKVAGQAAFFVTLFSGTTILDSVQALKQLAVDVLPAFAATTVDKVLGGVVTGLEKFQQRLRLQSQGHAATQAAAGNSDEGSLAAQAMSYLVVAMVAWFAKSIVETFAQQRQEELDEVHYQRLQAECEEYGTEMTIAMFDQEVADFDEDEHAHHQQQQHPAHHKAHHHHHHFSSARRPSKYDRWVTVGSLLTLLLGAAGNTRVQALRGPCLVLLLGQVMGHVLGRLGSEGIAAPFWARLSVFAVLAMIVAA